MPRPESWVKAPFSAARLRRRRTLEIVCGGRLMRSPRLFRNCRESCRQNDVLLPAKLVPEGYGYTACQEMSPTGPTVKVQGP